VYLRRGAAVSEHCDGTGYLPRSMGWKLPDGTYTGMCISCQEFHPMTEVIPPSKPTYRREFRLAPHTPGDGPKDPEES